MKTNEGQRNQGGLCVSAVIPVYNEALAVGDTLARLERALETAPRVERFEIIMVDDASTDGGLENARLPQTAKVVRHDRNRGYGASLKSGIAEAQYPLIVICDSDGSYEVEAIPRLLDRWVPSGMIVAARDDIRYPENHQIKTFSRRLFHLWLLLVSFRRIQDVNSGLRVFERKLVLPLFGELSDRFSFTTGLTLHWALSGWPFDYVPTHYSARSGYSKVRFLSDSVRTFLKTISITRRRNPTRLCMILAGFGLIVVTVLWALVHVGRMTKG
jgi:glycosyltransferase involved in cell wall biosynthesis